uniref:WD_REPEATS_REGION domain-containing protein n=1 Tax=Rhabditophanes sp. KR3021 TaxID=114890 RepID=A0AC35U0X8_9BILA
MADTKKRSKSKNKDEKKSSKRSSSKKKEAKEVKNVIAYEDDFEDDEVDEELDEFELAERQAQLDVEEARREDDRIKREVKEAEKSRKEAERAERAKNEAEKAKKEAEKAKKEMERDERERKEMERVEKEADFLKTSEVAGERLGDPYADDFESEEESILNDLQTTQTSIILSRLNNRSSIDTSSYKPPPTASSRKMKPTRQRSAGSRIIDFENAPRTIDLDASTKSAARFHQFKELVGLESVSNVLESIPPIKDYDFYMALFGQVGKIQVGSQSGDDNVSVECQSEEVDKASVWVQHPSNDTKGWDREGGEVENDIEEEERKENELYESFKKSHMTNDKLIKLVSLTSKLVEAITGLESRQKTKAISRIENKSEFPFSYGYDEISHEMFAVQSTVTAMAFNESDKVAVCVYMKESKFDKHNKQSFVLEFNIFDFMIPSKIFKTFGQVNSLGYSVDKDNYLACGLTNGVVVLYDLKKSESGCEELVFKFNNEKKTFPIRSPSYDTSFEFLDGKGSEPCPIVGVHCMGSKEDNTVLQVVTLDELGILSVWTVLENIRNIQNIEFNMGLYPNSNLFLTRAETLKPFKAIPQTILSSTRVIANQMATITSKNSFNFLIGTDKGCVLNLSKFKKLTASGPRLLTFKEIKDTEIISIKVSPFNNYIFAIGTAAGFIAICDTLDGNKKVLLVPPTSSRHPVTFLEWSPVEPTTLYSIHNNVKLLAWNIQVGKSPLLISDLRKSFGTLATITSTLSFLGINDYPFLGFGLSNGTTQIHRLEKISKNNFEKDLDYLRKGIRRQGM